MIISPGFFSVFQNFGFLGCKAAKMVQNGVMGCKGAKNGQKMIKKGKKLSKMIKNSVCCTPYLKNHTLYDCHLWYTFVK